MVSTNMQTSQRSQTVATSGTIQGSITDPAGAVVPGAAITIVNTGIQASRTFSGLSFLSSSASHPLPKNRTEKRRL